MRKTILMIILCSVLLVTIIGCEKKNKAENSGGVNVANAEVESDKNSEAKQNSSKTINNSFLEMNIPSDWQYEELTQDADKSYKYALKLYKSQENKNATLYIYNDMFTVCGTGRETKKIDLNNGGQASVGYYEDNVWNDISFYELNPNIAIINDGLESDEALEVLDFIKTLNIK